jgi:cytochrome c553
MKIKTSSLAALTVCALSVGTLAFGARPATAADIGADAEKAALQKTIETCATCHGKNGRSISPTFPNLAAQTKPYLVAQLSAFRDQKRADPDAQAYMWGMASQLTDATIDSLADYFSAQAPIPPVSHPGNPALVAEGKKLFDEGIPAAGVPACASCHGATAAGLTIFPRLAGQHAPYLYKQLLVIQSVLRTAPVMHGVIKDLTRDQMQAVVAYLESI